MPSPLLAGMSLRAALSAMPEQPPPAVAPAAKGGPRVKRKRSALSAPFTAPLPSRLTWQSAVLLKSGSMSASLQSIILADPPTAAQLAGKGAECVSHAEEAGCALGTWEATRVLACEEALPPGLSRASAILRCTPPPTGGEQSAVEAWTRGVSATVRRLSVSWGCTVLLTAVGDKRVRLGHKCSVTKSAWQLLCGAVIGVELTASF